MLVIKTAQEVEKIQRKIKLNIEKDPSTNQIVRSTAIGAIGIDGRYLQRESTDADYRIMYGDLIMVDGFDIIFDSVANFKEEIKDPGPVLSKLRRLVLFLTNGLTLLKQTMVSSLNK